jgi:hypothetical protein
VDLKVGLRLKSQACSTNVMIVRAPSGDVDLRCGGLPMQPMESASTSALSEAFAGGTEMGKRYVFGDDVEVLCTSPGQGSLSVGEELFVTKDAKSLPTSD